MSGAEPAQVFPHGVDDGAPEGAVVDWSQWALPGGPGPVGSVSFDVLSVATAGASSSERTFPATARLGGGRPVRLGVDLGRGDRARRTVVRTGASPTILDVAAAIDEAKAGVRAWTVVVGDGSLRLVVRAVETGRHTDVTLTDGREPPSLLTALGRFRRDAAACDTVLRVRTPEGFAIRSSSTREVVGVVPAVTVTAHIAAPGRRVTIHWEDMPDATDWAVLPGTTPVGSAAGLDTLRDPTAAALSRRPAAGAPVPLHLIDRSQPHG